MSSYQSEGVIEFRSAEDFNFCIENLDHVKLDGHYVRVIDEREYNRKKLRTNETSFLSVTAATRRRTSRSRSRSRGDALRDDRDRTSRNMLDIRTDRFDRDRQRDRERTSRDIRDSRAERFDRDSGRGRDRDRSRIAGSLRDDRIDRRDRNERQIRMNRVDRRDDDGLHRQDSRDSYRLRSGLKIERDRRIDPREDLRRKGFRLRDDLKDFRSPLTLRRDRFTSPVQMSRRRSPSPILRRERRTSPPPITGERQRLRSLSPVVRDRTRLSSRSVGRTDRTLTGFTRTSRDMRTTVRVDRSYRDIRIGLDELRRERNGYGTRQLGIHCIF